MDLKEKEMTNLFNERLQNILNSLSKCKTDFINDKEEIRRLNDINSKLEVELKEAREFEKSHRYHLLTSREMINNLQETVSHLVYLKRDTKKLKEEIIAKDLTITAIEKDKDNVLRKHEEIIKELRSDHEKQIEELKNVSERKLQQVQLDADTQVAQYSCAIEELQNKIKEIDTEHRDKMNAVVLEYEEKLQRSAALEAQLQEQLVRQAEHAHSNVDAYRRRLEELEEKLKQSQFKQYLAQSTYHSPYETQVERPYSLSKDLIYPDTCSADVNSVFEITKPKQTPVSVRNRASKPANTLHVTYYDNTSNTMNNSQKKKQFNISKKRKLYNEKEFQEF